MTAALFPLTDDADIDMRALAKVSCRDLTVNQRAMIGAAVLDRYTSPDARTPSPAGGGVMRQPVTRSAAARMFDVSTAQIDRARIVTNRAIDELKTAAYQGKVPITTAARVATTMTPTEQRQFVRKVAGGAKPRVIAPPDGRPSGALPPIVAKPITGTARIRKRVNVLDADTIARITATWSGYAFGLADITGIDPAATADQCEQWARSITATIKALSRLRKLIRETDTTP